jgi:adenine-specific DNA-methyltransferase
MKQKEIKQYEHSDKDRPNNPPVGLVSPNTDPDTGIKKSYHYDPHLDPQLQWAGKTEHSSFEVPTISLHVHERIDPKSIIESVKKEKDDHGQMSLFDEPKPLREAIDFYKHKDSWSNRMIAGDSLLVMNSKKRGWRARYKCSILIRLTASNTAVIFSPLFINVTSRMAKTKTSAPNRK